LPSDKLEPRTYGAEVNVETLVSSAILTQAIASKIFKVYAPALFMRRVRCKVMLGVRRPFANSGDILPDISGQAVYVFRIPGIILACATRSGAGRKSTAGQ
jgi:hypothetical protein